MQPPKRHFVFSGPSGTGKTTVARILGRVFYALGLLGGDHLVEAQRADLVGEFLGQTAVKANELIDSAHRRRALRRRGVPPVQLRLQQGRRVRRRGPPGAAQARRGQPRPPRRHPRRLPGGHGPAARRQPRARPPASPPASTSPATARWNSPRSARCWPPRTATCGTRRRSTSCAASAGTSSTRAGSTSWATAASCAPCTRRAAPTATCGCPATRASPTRDDLATLRLPDLMQAYGEVLSGRGPQDRRRGV